VTRRTIRIFMMDFLATVPYYTAYLTRALISQHVDVTLGSVSYYLDRTCFSSRGVKLFPGCVDLVSQGPFPRMVRRPLKLLEALLNQSIATLRFLFVPPDVLHVQFLPMLTWSLPFDLWFVLLCRKRGIKIVLTVHDLLPHDTGEAHRAKFLKLYHSVDWIICHSEHVRERLAREFLVVADMVSVIPHGPFFYDLVPVTAKESLMSLNSPPGAVRVLWQGIIRPYKGVDLLLEAWQRVEALGRGHKLVVAGTGPADLLQAIRQQVESLKLRNVELRLEFISTSELVRLHREADLVVYPYRAITTSGALATGLALGKTIIASDLPAFRELLTNRENALLFDPQNSNELAAAMIELIQDSHLRDRLAANVKAMDFGEQSWISIARMTTEAYVHALTW
jgi:glycosyltransferase involved in cell wall biosynthesis